MLRGGALAVFLALATRIHVAYSQPTPEIKGTSIINDRSNREILGALKGNSLDYTRVGTSNVNVHFIPGENTNSILVTLDDPEMSFCETAAPFALFRRNRRRTSPTFPLGRRVISATPYSGSKCRGRKGERLDLVIRVSESPLDEVELPFKVAPPLQIVPREPPPINTRSLQPKVSVIESSPAQKLAGIMALPEGSPWCDGLPTLWTPGHRAENDSPFCLNGTKWSRPFLAHMDDNDDLNDIDGPGVIDRHDCGVLDVNNDGIVDVFCQVGANSGRGEGYNELYLTKKDGSIEKVKRHGLQKHNGMRGRFLALLNGPDDEKFVFSATKGVPRADDKSNKHRMFRKTGSAPYFKEVGGPWVVHSNASCAYTVDLNSDGLDDFVICNERAPPLFFLQRQGRSWKSVDLDFPERKTNRRLVNWRKVRVADVTGDGIDDLIVIYWGDKADLQVFAGIRKEPFFDYRNPYFSTALPNAAPDLEIIDVDGDGRLDIYVIQSDERRFNRNGSTRKPLPYCAGKFKHSQWWPKGNQPPPEFVPPKDTANDYIYLNRVGDPFDVDPFLPVRMRHTMPGCGSLVRPFGPKKLILAQGDFVRPGYQLLLEW